MTSTAPAKSEIVSSTKGDAKGDSKGDHKGDSTADDAAASSRPVPTVKELQQVLVDEKAPIAKRMRTVFMLRQRGGKEAIDALASGEHESPAGLYHALQSSHSFSRLWRAGVRSPSVLLGHEIAFVLGET